MTLLSLLIGILAVTNFAKPVPVTSDTGFVLFGERLAGTASAVAGAIAGVILTVYAVGIWRLRKWALPLGWVYSGYVVANIVLFRLRYPMPDETGHQVFEILYPIIAISGAVGTALLLTRRRRDLA